MRIARLAAFAAALAVPAIAHAQLSATVNATATVVTPLAVTGVAPLAFGNVFQGVAKSVAYTDATSGRFSVTGFGTSQVAFTFTLPANLTSGANPLPIDQYAVAAGATNVAASASALTLVSGSANANLVTGALYLFVGGRVTPSTTQAAGAYSGTITVAAAYTGN